MEKLYEKATESASYVKGKINGEIDVAVILGSGLGSLVDKLENKVYIPYSEIPHFPVSTVSGHGNQLVYGEVNGNKVLALQGRFHFYEGYTMKEVTYPVYMMKLLGVPKMIVTNSCGGMNSMLEPGDLMIITDFINLMGTNPLIGENDERFGTRFPDMTEPYCLEFMRFAEEVAEKHNIRYKKGVYSGFMGPYYETAAEIRGYRDMGGDAIGMSTVPETIVANYLGIKVLGIACITNMATGIQKMKHSHERVLEVAKKSSIEFSRWIEHIVEEL